MVKMPTADGTERSTVRIATAAAAVVGTGFWAKPTAALEVARADTLPTGLDPGPQVAGAPFTTSSAPVVIVPAVARETWQSVSRMQRNEPGSHPNEGEDGDDKETTLIDVMPGTVCTARAAVISCGRDLSLLIKLVSFRHTESVPVSRLLLFSPVCDGGRVASTGQPAPPTVVSMPAPGPTTTAVKSTAVNSEVARSLEEFKG